VLYIVNRGVTVTATGAPPPPSHLCRRAADVPPLPGLWSGFCRDRRAPSAPLLHRSPTRSSAHRGRSDEDNGHRAKRWSGRNLRLNRNCFRVFFLGPFSGGKFLWTPIFFLVPRDPPPPWGRGGVLSTSPPLGGSRPDPPGLKKKPDREYFKFSSVVTSFFLFCAGPPMSRIKKVHRNNSIPY